MTTAICREHLSRVSRTDTMRATLLLLLSLVAWASALEQSRQPRSTGARLLGRPGIGTKNIVSGLAFVDRHQERMRARRSTSKLVDSLDLKPAVRDPYLEHAAVIF